MRGTLGGHEVWLAMIGSNGVPAAFWPGVVASLKFIAPALLLLVLGALAIRRRQGPLTFWTWTFLAGQCVLLVVGVLLGFSEAKIHAANRHADEPLIHAVFALSIIGQGLLGLALIGVSKGLRLATLLLALGFVVLQGGLFGAVDIVMNNVNCPAR